MHRRPRPRRDGSSPVLAAVRSVFVHPHRALAALAAGGAGAAALLFAALVLAQPPVLDKGPLIRLDARRWDFGRMQQYENATHVFQIRNDGTAPLKILQIDSTCGCTVASPEDSVLVPGEGTELRVTFSSKNYEGQQQKIVMLRTNDPAEPRIDLVITADVVPYVRVSERSLDFGPVRRGDAASVTTRLSADKGVDFEVRGIEGADSVVTWEVIPVADPSARVYDLRAELRPDAPLGHFSKRVTVRLKHPKTPEERIFIQGIVYSYFRPEHRRINFATVKQGKEYKSAIRIAADGRKAFAITDAVATASYLDPTLRRDGSDYVLEVRLDAPSRPGRFREAVVLKTTDPQEPEIRFDMVGIVLQ